ncbi:MAG: S1/P1 Nuclease [Flavobacteriales bacterium]|nr:S1/P1 Nuclease [Flavobacteriales bacterium]
MILTKLAQATCPNRQKSVALILAVTLNFLCSSWGFQAHREINQIAVYGLPPELFGFYRDHLDYLAEHAVSADMRRYIDTAEGARHYLDVDFYEGSFPLDTVRCSWDSIQARYGSDVVQKHGVLPWNLIRNYQLLKWAFRQHDADAVLRLSADIGHYVGDLHVPLHTTANYNGQLTNQHGIHGLWETRLVELQAFGYDLLVDTASFIPNVPEFIWHRLEESARMVDSVLRLEQRITDEVGEENKFQFDTRKSAVSRQYSRLFCEHYHRALNHMVERRMRSAIHAVRCLWMSAWVEAGQPDMRQFEFHSAAPVRFSVDSLFRFSRMLGRPEH